MSELLASGALRSGAARLLRRAGAGAYRGRRYGWARIGLRLALIVDRRDRIARLLLGRAEQQANRPEAGLRVVEVGLDEDPGWLAGAVLAVALCGELGRSRDAAEILSGLENLGRGSSGDFLPLLDAAAAVVPRQAAELGIALSLRDPVSDQLAARAAFAIGRVEERETRLDLAHRLAASGGDPGIAEVVKILVAEGRLDKACELAQRIRSVRCRAAREAARALSGAGFPSLASALLERAGGEPRARKLRDRIDAQLRVFGGWRPRVARRELDPLPKRVLHVCHASILDQVSGYTVRTHRNARASVAEGLEAGVATLAGYGGQPRERDGWETVEGVPYMRIRAPRARELPADERLQLNLELASEVVAEFRPAILHAASDYQNATVALSIRDSTSIPVVYEVRGFWEETWLARQPAAAIDSDAYRMRREVNRQCMLDADHVVTLSETMRDELVRRGVDTNHISVVPHGVDPAELYPVERDPQLAARFGIGSSDFVVGYVGSLLAYEGLDLLVAAVAALREQSTAVHCVIAGEGPERDRLHRLSHELGIAARVHISGEVPRTHVRDYLGLIDTFVLPRLDLRVCRMVTPLKPWEAMAAGVPLIVADLDPLREIVGDGDAGLTVEPGSADELATAIAELIETPRLVERLGERARQQALEQWRTGKRLPAIYEKVLGR